MTARRLTVFLYVVAAIALGNGILQVVLASSSESADRLVIAGFQLAAGAGILVGAFLTHRDYRRRGWKLRPPIRER